MYKEKKDIAVKYNNNLIINCTRINTMITKFYNS